MWLSFVIKRCFVGVFFSVDWNMKLNSIITITLLLGCIHVNFLGMWNCVVDRQFSNLLMVMLLWVEGHEFYFFSQTHLYLLLFSSFSPLSCVFVYSSHMFSISLIFLLDSHHAPSPPSLSIYEALVTGKTLIVKFLLTFKSLFIVSCFLHLQISICASFSALLTSPFTCLMKCLIGFHYHHSCSFLQDWVSFGIIGLIIMSFSFLWFFILAFMVYLIW
jgi:hypothetical protein